MSDSNIEWCDKTWNVTRGCRRVSAGCGGANGEGGCYAERMAYRFSGAGQAYDGLVKMTANGPRWTGVGRFAADKLADPLRWRKPARIFVDSMSDLFFEEFSNEQIAAVFGVMAACPQHVFQILTKRPKRMREWFAWAAKYGDGYDALRFGPSALLTCAWEACSGDAWGDIEPPGKLESLPSSKVFGDAWPPPNVHLGVSIENQDAADERIPDLLATPAAVRFISAEPLLGDIDIRPWSGRPLRCTGDEPCPACARNDGTKCRFSSDLPGIDHVIAGCESGPGARYCSVEWLRSLRDQCTAADVPFFCKQAVEDATGIVAPTLAPYEIIKAVSPIDRTRFTDAITSGPGSHRKTGGIIGLPYLDGVQHKELPR